MAVKTLRAEPLTIERIRRRRRPAKVCQSERTLSAMLEAVRSSGSVEQAIDVLNAINATWSHPPAEACDATDFLLRILQLTCSVEDALAVVAMLRNDVSLRIPLKAIQEFVQAEFPDARIRLRPGDEVSSAYLEVHIPTRDYSSFWAAHIRLRDWTIEHVPNLFGLIHVMSLPSRGDV